MLTNKDLDNIAKDLRCALMDLDVKEARRILKLLEDNCFDDWEELWDLHEEAESTIKQIQYIKRQCKQDLLYLPN